MRALVTVAPPLHIHENRLVLVTQVLRPGDLEFSIEIPTGWVVIVDTQSGMVRALLAGRLTHRDYECVVEATAADFHLESFELASDLTTHAEAQMAKHVRQGQPGRFADVVGGVPALGFTWTDGVALIATWFVSPRSNVGVCAYHSIPTHRESTDERSDGASLLKTLRWQLPNKEF